MRLSAEEMGGYACRTLAGMISRLGVEGTVEVAGTPQGLRLKITAADPARLIGRRGRILDNLEYLLGRALAYKSENPPRVRLELDGYERKAEPRRERDEGPGEPAEGNPVEQAVGEPGGDRGYDRGERGERGGRGGRGRRGRGGEPGGERRGGRPGERGGDPRLRQLALDAAKEVKRWGEAKTLGPYPLPDRRTIHLTLKDDPEIEAQSGEELPDGRKSITIRLRDKTNPAAAPTGETAPGNDE
ncbi:MAG: hypothetical protein BWZ02_01387 [Lentisphaerae bacterium ADurb.BinA184]|nr:MAG: hypothetical protein BWZ02_01387 [Lentisphaerae bacterium ADurb.BinA184]